VNDFKRFLIILLVYALIGPVIGTIVVAIIITVLNFTFDWHLFVILLTRLPGVVLAGLPLGFALGILPAATCGIVLGMIAVRRGRFSFWAAALAGLLIGSLFAFGRFSFGIPPDQRPNLGLLSMIALFLVVPAFIASIGCRSIAKRLGVFLP
jgi:hypothetical protein